MATIGRHDAVTELANGWRFSGPIGWLAWLGLHLVYLMGFRNRIKVFVDWTWNYLTYDRGNRILPRGRPSSRRARAGMTSSSGSWSRGDHDPDRNEEVPCLLLLRSAPETSPSRAARSSSSTASTSSWPAASGSASSGPTASASRRCCGRSPGSCRSTRGRVERTPPTATVGYLPQEPRRAPDESVARVPRPPHRRHRCATRRSTRRPTRSPPATPGADDRYAVALERWLALGGADLDARIGAGAGPTSGSPAGCSTSRRRRCRAARRRGPGWRRCCSPATTCSSSTSRPTTSTSPGSTRLERWITELQARRRARQPRPHVPRAHGHRRRRDRRVHPTAPRLRRRLAGLPRRARARRGGTPGSASRSTTPSARRCADRAQREREWAEPGPGQGRARRATSRTRSSAPSRSTRPRSSPAKAARTERAIERLDDGRQAARAVGAAAVGRRRPAAAATSSPGSTARSSSAATSRSGRSTSSRRRRAGRARRCQRQRQDDAARRAARPRRAVRRATAALGPERRRRRDRAGSRPARRRTRPLLRARSSTRPA